MQLLLLSNSTCPGKRYLEHAIGPIGDLLQGRRRALFIPFAGVIVDWDDYTDKVSQALEPLAVEVTGIHRTSDAGTAVANAEAIIIGGGNTFHLLKHCRDRGLLRAVHRRVHEGAAYIGWSAGANLACPTLCTTNDMPIVDPGGFEALGLINFQINPHYTNQLPAGHQGETRQQRLDELLRAQPELTVVGLPEGDWLTVADGTATLAGPYDAALYRADLPEPGGLTPGSTVPRG